MMFFLLFIRQFDSCHTQSASFLKIVVPHKVSNEGSDIFVAGRGLLSSLRLLEAAALCCRIYFDVLQSMGITEVANRCYFELLMLCCFVCAHKHTHTYVIVLIFLQEFTFTDAGRPFSFHKVPSRGKINTLCCLRDCAEKSYEQLQTILQNKAE